MKQQKNNKAVYLKAGREKSISRRHPWIFSGSVQKSDSFDDGDILWVKDCQGKILGQAYFNTRCSLAGRMLSFGDVPALDAIKANLQRAYSLRQSLVQSDQTNCYRLVNSEGDFIPGLVVDVYDRILALQVSTLGIEKLKPFLIEQLVELTKCAGIYEKSRMPSRAEEGLEDSEGWLYRLSESLGSQVQVSEHGVLYLVDLAKAQKTGLFLDHREMRWMIRKLSQQREVLNLFAYTGGFSLNAELGGASKVITVDSSDQALLLAHKNYQLNSIEVKPDALVCEDAFDYLDHCTSNFDLIILDPPAFVKHRNNLEAATRAYQRINSQALRLLRPGGLLLTCSCSHYFTEELFRNMLFKVACQSGRSLRVLGRHTQAWDHPTSIFHVEGEYLKSALLCVD